MNSNSFLLMKKKYCILFIVSFLYSQFDVNFSLESKFAKDSFSTYENPTFLENYLDINLYLDDLYIFTQLEYSSPPLMGSSKKNLSDAMNMIYVEYFNDYFQMTLGNIYTMQGMGLSLHTYQDQDIDYDNSLYGFEAIYDISDNSSFFLLAGKRNILSRLSPQEVVPSISIQNRVLSLGFNRMYDNFSFHYLAIHNEQEYDYTDILDISALPTLLGHYLVDNHINYMIQNEPSFNMKNLEHNFGFNYYSDYIEITYERSQVFYHRLLSERDEGYREYMSTYFNVLGFDVMLEHKDYNTPYLYSLFSNPPIVSRESNSILSSRNVHSLNFNNELGHQLKVDKVFNSGLNFLFNYAFAIHYDEDVSTPSILKLYTYMFDLISDKNYIQEFTEFNPYRQLYTEFSWWNRKEKQYYRIAYDYYNEHLVDKTVSATTYPMQFTSKLKSEGSSITIYLEYQEESKNNIEHTYYYFSPSYNHFGEWTFTLFYDYEEDGDSWIGGDCTINMNNSDQLSLFYGSQKGGLVCANGSCVIQPDFDEGIKLTYRTSF